MHPAPCCWLAIFGLIFRVEDFGWMPKSSTLNIKPKIAGCQTEIKNRWMPKSSTLNIKPKIAGCQTDAPVRRRAPRRATRESPIPTEGPMWGHPMPVLGALSPFLEPFCGHLSPKIDKVSEELTLRYHHEEPWVGSQNPQP